MINVNFILAQILGVIATLIICLSYNVKNKKKFLIFSLLGDIIYGTTFLLVGTLSTCLIVLVSSVQYVFVYSFDKQNKKMPIWLGLLFSCLFIVVGIITMECYWDIIPIITYVYFTFALYIENVKTIRYMYLLPNILLVVYDFVVTAYASAFEDGIEAGYLLLVIIIEFIKAKNKKYYKTINATQDKSLEFIKNRGANLRSLQSAFINNDFETVTTVKEDFIYAISFRNLYPPPMRNCYNNLN